MGTLEKDGSSKPLSFDGKAASWPPFKKALHQLLDKEVCVWVVEGGNAFCAMLQAAAAQAAKKPRNPEKAQSQQMSMTTAFPCIRDSHVGQLMTGHNHRLEHSLLNDSARTPNNRALAT